MSVVSKLKFLLQAIDDGGLGSENIQAPARHLFDFSNRFPSGTADGKHDVVWSDRRTLGATSTDSIDILGSLTNSFGSTVNIAELCGILIVNRTTTSTSTLTLKATTSTGLVGLFSDLTDKIIIGPAIAGPPVVYGMFWWYNPRGIAVSSSTDDLDISTPSTGATYDICLLGRSA